MSDSNATFVDAHAELANKIRAILASRGVLEPHKDRVESEIQQLLEYGVTEDLFVIYQRIEKEPELKGKENKLNSMVGYLLGVTDKAPTGDFTLEKRRTYGRAGFPDVDMDFDDKRRDEVIEYITNKYGDEYVGRIGTVQVLKTKAALRRVIKAIDPDRSVIFDDQGRKIKEDDSENFALQNSVCKSLPDRQGVIRRPDNSVVKNIREAYESFPEFRKYMDMYPEVYRFSTALEGSISSFGAHAAGIVVSPIPLRYICPLHSTGNTKTVATQFSMVDVESMGLIKLDVLGLLTKRVVSLAHKWIKDDTGTDIDLSMLPLSDKKTLDLLNSGKTDGCFQLENTGMKQTLQQIGIDSFSDLIVAIAMYRPGPKDYIPEFAKRKRHPRSVTYVHPVVERYTRDTYGIIAYQEQAMQVFVNLAGLTTSEGYVFIKGAAKKKPELFQSMKRRFIDGASRIANKQVAEEVWKQMEPFQGYAFNKSLQWQEKIRTSEKDISIQELYNRKIRGEALPEVYDPHGRSIRIVDVYDHGVVPVWKVTFSDGSVHKCTIHHKFLTDEGVLPLHEVIERGITVRKHRFENAQEKRLDMCLWQDSRESTSLCGSPEGLRNISSEQERFRVRGLSSEVYSSWSACSQETMRVVEAGEIGSLFGVQRENVQKVLGGDRTRRYSVASVQKEDVKICIGSNSLKSEGSKKTICSDEGVKQEAFCIVSEKQSINCPEEFFARRYFATKNGASEAVEIKSSRFVSETMRGCSNEAECLAFECGEFFAAYSLPVGVQIQSKRFSIPFYYQKSSTAGRFCELGSKGDSGIRWRTTFQNELAKKLEGSTRKGRRVGQNPDGRGFFDSSRIVRYVATRRKPIQVSADATNVNACCLLPRQRCCEEGRESVRVKRVEYVGLQQCYDLEVDSSEHLYCLASGIINSNSHACSYAYESWKTAYLKAHYPTHFMAARLTVEADNRSFDDLAKYEADARALGIKILPPDINRSKMHYVMVSENHLLSPIIIKGIGDHAAEEIVSNQPYHGNNLIYAFASRVGKSVNSKVVEALYDAGMFGKKVSKNNIINEFEQIKKDKVKAKGRQIGDLFE